MKEEIRKIVKSLKKKKATGEDNIPNEAFINGGEKMIEIIME